MTNAKFNQPIFDSNNFTASCAVLPGGGLDVPSQTAICSCILAFPSGGGDSFAMQWAQFSSKLEKRRAMGTVVASMKTKASYEAGTTMYYNPAQPKEAFASTSDLPPSYSEFADECKGQSKKIQWAEISR